MKGGGGLGKGQGMGTGHTLYDVHCAALVAFFIGELVHFAAAFEVEH